MSYNKISTALVDAQFQLYCQGSSTTPTIYKKMYDVKEHELIASNELQIVATIKPGIINCATLTLAEPNNALSKKVHIKTLIGNENAIDDTINELIRKTFHIS